MGFQFTPYTPIALAAFLISVALVVFSMRHRGERGRGIFMLLMLGASLWTLSSVLELTSTTLAGKIVFSSTAYLGIATVPMLWLVFVLSYTGRDQFLTRNWLIGFAIPPVIVLLVVFTNPLHQVYWSQITLDTSRPVIVGSFERGVLWWVHFAYAYTVLFIGSAVLVRSFLQSPDLYRGQIRLMLLATAMPWIANLMFATGIRIAPDYFDITPLAFVITGVLSAWGVFGFRLLDIVPVARTVVFERMDDAVFVFDTQNRVIDANPAALKLIGGSSATIGQYARDVFADQSALLDQYRDVQQADAEITLDQDGQMYYYKIRITPLRTARGHMTGRIAVLHDITELKETNRQLELARIEADENSRLKSQFLATMSHELRTPLNAVIGYTELQLTGMVGELSDVQYKYGERVLANARHLLGLINDILDISKIEAGRMTVIAEPFRLQTWIEKIFDENAVLAEDKGLQFIQEIDSNLPEIIIGDETRLRQILVNLISNAIKFTEQGAVYVRFIKQAETVWRIEVQDTGIGIPTHKLETIFNEFQQVDGSLSRQYEGTGLGLAIVRKLVILMGGTIQVESSVGEGSTFIVTLPLASNNQTIPAPVAQS